MASIVSAGTTSATALNMSADTTGILQLASNNGTVALTVNTGQQIGIGTASPANLFHVSTSTAANSKLEQTSTGANYLTLRSNGSDRAFIGLENSSGSGLFGGGTAYGLSIGTTGSSGIAFATNNTVAAKIDTSANLQFNSGYGSVATAYGCRAWAQLSGGGGSGGSPSTQVFGGGNVSSITKNSTSNYSVFYTNAMPDGIYSAFFSSETGNVTLVSSQVVYNYYTTNLNIVNANGGTQNDFRTGSIAVFR